MPARKLTCGEAAVRLLSELGAEVCFGVPGLHTIEYYSGLAEGWLRPVLARHEQGAAFMADGYARATGRPAVCCVISGPGVTNAATPIAQAYSDSVPMFVLASGNPEATLGNGWGLFHELRDQFALGELLTGGAVRASSADAVPAAVNSLWAAATAGRPRPQYLEVPVDVLAEPVDGDWAATVTAPQVPEAAPDVVDAVRDLLLKAERPALVVGGGCRGAASAVRALVSALSLPVVTTIAGRGVVPETHPLSLGATLSRPETQEWLSRRDAILVLGSELAESDTWVVRLDLKARLARVDVDPARLDDAHGGDIGVVADADAFARALVATAPSVDDPPRRDAEREIAEVRTRIDASLTPLQRRHQQLLAALRGALPPEGMVFSDMAQIAYSGNFLFEVEEPGRWFHPVGLGTLGWAVPSAIGAAIGAPDRPVVALVGDSGLLFTVNELATAAELQLPLAVVVCNNDALGRIHEDMTARGMPPVSVLPRNPDIPALARAFGFHSETPATMDQVPAALRRAIECDGPALVELREHDLFA